MRRAHRYLHHDTAKHADLVYRLLGEMLDESNLDLLNGAKVGETFRLTKHAGQDFITLEVSFRVTKDEKSARRAA